MRHYITQEVELFTGAPRRRQVPQPSVLDLRPRNKKVFQKSNISTGVWGAWKIKLENKTEVVLTLIETKNATIV